jgi:hypothetical protein
MSGPIAPEQPLALASPGSYATPGPDIVDYRQRVERTVDVRQLRTVSAGAEIGRIPMVFDLPSNLRRIFRGLRTGMKTTLLAPELQSEIMQVGGANVMVQKGMLPPYQIVEPGPWYASFTETLG